MDGNGGGGGNANWVPDCSADGECVYGAMVRTNYCTSLWYGWDLTCYCNCEGGSCYPMGHPSAGDDIYGDVPDGWNNRCEIGPVNRSLKSRSRTSSNLSDEVTSVLMPSGFVYNFVEGGSSSDPRTWPGSQVIKQGSGKSTSSRPGTNTARRGGRMKQGGGMRRGGNTTRNIIKKKQHGGTVGSHNSGCTMLTSEIDCNNNSICNWDYSNNMCY